MDWFNCFSRQFRITRDLKRIDCSVRHDERPFISEKPFTPQQRERALWASIDKAFSEPTTKSDDTAEYAATQLLAELFRSAGYDGIAYKSAFGEKGFNIALFDLDSAELRTCGLFEVTKVKYEFRQSDNPYFVQVAK